MDSFDIVKSKIYPNIIVDTLRKNKLEIELKIIISKNIQLVFK